MQNRMNLCHLIMFSVFIFTSLVSGCNKKSEVVKTNDENWNECKQLLTIPDNTTLYYVCNATKDTVIMKTKQKHEEEVGKRGITGVVTSYVIYIIDFERLDTLERKGIVINNGMGISNQRYNQDPNCTFGSGLKASDDFRNETTILGKSFNNIYEIVYSSTYPGVTKEIYLLDETGLRAFTTKNQTMLFEKIN